MREVLIKKVVKEFYDIAQVDVMIGYHFRHIPDFATHLPRIEAFWKSQLLGITPKQQAPFQLIQAHIPLKIKIGEVNRWVLLFNKILDQQQEEKEFINLWKKKIEQFREIFLRTKELF